MPESSVSNFNRAIKPTSPGRNKDVDAKKVVAIAAIILLSMYLIVNFLWVLRLGTLAHWSYLVGVTMYPKDSKHSMWLSASLFLFISIGSFIPNFLCPRLKNFALALSVPPQLHMLLLLNKVHKTLDNYFLSSKTITTIVRIYTLTTLGSAMWTIFNIFL